MDKTNFFMNTDYSIRRAVAADLDDMMEIFEFGKQIMRTDGNMLQWTGGYPQRELVAAEIGRGNSYVVLADDGVVVATFALILSDDPTYRVIYNGQWTDDVLPYGTIHRIASHPDYHDVARQCFNYAWSVRPNLRVDTHADNRIMQQVLLKSGFRYCGIIHLANGDERLAYQKVDALNCISPSLHDYVVNHILPQYDAFDEAHQQAHARSVIRESLDLAMRYNANTNLAFAVAAFHDLGLADGREFHHVKSAEYVRADKMLHKWFSKAQIEVMADAVEDHRASAKKEPRTLYGRIVAEADRYIDGDDIMRRTLLFGKKNYPDLGLEQHLLRAKQHLAEKYAEGGYLRLWFADSANAARLKAFQQRLKDAEWVDSQLRQLAGELGIC